MIPDLPADFIQACNSKTRRPVLVAHMYFPDGKVFHLSDVPITIAGIYYTPIISNWGVLSDASSIRASLINDALEAKFTTIEIINTGTISFYHYFKTIGIENVRFDIYQWFSDIAESSMTILGSFICQPPINLSENSIKLTMDLVSPIMKGNRFLSGTEKQDSERFPLIIGKEYSLPLVDLKTAPWTRLLFPLDFGYTGEIIVLNAIGFESSGYIIIDTEVIAYNSKTNTTFNITARGQLGTVDRNHDSESIICDPDKNYDYAVCIGPVDVMHNLKAGGADYTNPFEILNSENPATVRFPGKLPWLDVASTPGGGIPQPPESISLFGKNNTNEAGDTAPLAISPGNINNDTGVVEMNISSSLGDTTPTNTVAFKSYVVEQSFSAMNASASTSSGRISHWMNEPYSGMIGWRHRVTAGDHSSLGSFISAELKIACVAGSVMASYSTIKIDYNIGSGDVNLLNDSYTNAEIDWKTPQWVGRSWTIPLSINSWSQLESIQAVVEYLSRTSQGSYSDYNNYVDVVFIVTYEVPPTVTYPWQRVYSSDVSTINIPGSFDSATATFDFSTGVTNANVNRRIIFRANSSASIETLWSDSISSSESRRQVTVSIPVSSFPLLESAFIGIEQQIMGPTTGTSNRVSNTTVWSAKWNITHTPDDIPLPDAEKVFYAEDLTIEVIGNESNADNLTPADVIEDLLSIYGYSEFIDTESFELARQDYIANGYFVYGATDPGWRIHDALRMMLRIGMARLLHRQDKIGIVLHKNKDYTDMSFGFDDIKLRSFVEVRNNLDLMINDLTLYYDYDYAEQHYRGKIAISNADSMTRYGIREEKVEYGFIHDETTAQGIAQKLLDFYSKPLVELSFVAYMKAYPLEKNDIIYFQTNFNGYVGGRGEVLSVTRDFANGITNKMNTFQIRMITPETLAVIRTIEERLELSEMANISINFELTTAEELLLTESIAISTGGYGNGGYGMGGYGI